MTKSLLSRSATFFGSLFLFTSLFISSAFAQDGVGELVAVKSPLLKADTASGTLPGRLHVRAPAPPLSQMWVYAVYASPSCGWEYMTTRGQVSTTCAHSGTTLRVAVMEIGYGSGPSASLGGALPRSANYQSTPVCVVNGYYTFPCPAGSTVVGFLQYWNADGRPAANFATSDTSINSPFNTLSTGILIKG
ncbi:hypothetical protein K461DRAFT_281725 [Myriangium duriaei CBS 260.36]|uniref:Uncharacterized protein n=1 Tax=Myriangium duriaei CBS 260.36 TaxID=1168546 RepID=A0A9P4IV62_9PEZI|nr:hypothetical protein K461DRAFT_281725 [Myriangium duriaei CBS 260.36]